MKRGLMVLLAVMPMATALAEPKNILLIIADDYGVDSSALYNSTNSGASLPPTPAIASLAAAGVVFRNAYANPVCSPTRACLLTGRHAFRTGIGDVIMGPTSPNLTAGEFTLPDAFATNSVLGYQLAQFGKWHLGDTRTSPNAIGGWPHYAGCILGAVPSYTSWPKTIDGTLTPSTTNYATRDVVDDATAWIQARSAQPWFAWVAFNAPHFPLHKPPAALCPHYAGLSGTQPDINAHPRSYYEAMVEALDTEIGRLLLAVDRTNTHIIFMGDNGTPASVIQPPYQANHAKDTLYEGGIHVPLLVSGPLVDSPGRTNDTLVHAVDMYATILEMAGISTAGSVPTNVALDSRSLMPLLTNTSNPTRYAYSEKFGTATDSPDGRTLHCERFKLIQYDVQPDELYDLTVDPSEVTNLLTGTPTAAQQSNYNGLQRRIALYQDDLTASVVGSCSATTGQFIVTAPLDTNLVYTLWYAAELNDLAWSPLTNAVVTTNGPTVSLADPTTPSVQAYYQVTAVPP